MIWCVLVAVAVLVHGMRTDDVLAKDLTFRLHSGDRMPLVGYGTFRVRGTDLIRDVLDYAFGAGYRLIDTAKVYNNEEDIGKALKELLPKHNLTRKDIWISTKLATSDLGDKAYEALKESIRKLNCEYVDLYLIHSPGPRNSSGPNNTNSRLRDESWKQLVKGNREGLAKNIGVSNYVVRHLNELLANDHGVKPAVNQVEWHPHYHPQELLNLCRKEGILLQAYFSLGGTGNQDLINDPKVKDIAKKLGKTPAQILLKWSVQQNIAVIPKASSQNHIKENIDLNFIIPEEEMNILNNFDVRMYGSNKENIP